MTITIPDYSEPADVEGDEFLSEHRARIWRSPMEQPESENEKSTLPKIATEPPPAAFRPDEILEYFEYAHLPEHLARVSAPFGELALAMVNPSTGLPRCAERTVALRKLLEAKDCAVRAALKKS